MFYRSPHFQHCRRRHRSNTCGRSKHAWEDEEGREEMLKLIPYGRIGETEDIARAAVWLASDTSDYVIGTTLFVDGGMMLYPSFREGG
nr:SDR family oxidoreductase [Sulfitobacter delicatus]